MLPKVISPGQVPFSTTDTILAFCLYLAGIPFFDERKPCINIYDVAILKNLGFAGEKLEDGVRGAVKQKKKGHVEWAFKQVPELDRMLTAYRNQCQVLQESDGRLDELISGVILAVSDKQEKVMRLACAILKMRREFVSLWQKQDPLIRVFNEGKTTKTDPASDGSFRVSSPGFRIVSLNAKEETKARMKL